MKSVLVVGLLGCSFLIMLTGCGSDNSYDNTSDDVNSYQNCSEPSNPYGDGGGHDAGFNRAEQNGGGYCDGNSDSFNEGCEEYCSQLDEYETCIGNQ